MDEKPKDTKEDTEDKLVDNSKQPNQKKVDKQDKTKALPKKEENDDFKYIVRFSNYDVDGNKTIIHGLTSIQKEILQINKSNIFKK